MELLNDHEFSQLSLPDEGEIKDNDSTKDHIENDDLPNPLINVLSSYLD